MLRGWQVRGRDQDDAALKQPLEQPAQDHRVGDVGDVEFIEAQQPALVGELTRDLRDRVAVRGNISFGVQALGLDVLMHLGHEFMKMHAALLGDRRHGKKEIHQHGLAAAHVAVEIEPARRASARAPQQPPERGRTVGGAIARERIGQLAQAIDHRALGAVALELARGEARGIVCGNVRRGGLVLHHHLDLPRRVALKAAASPSAS